MPLRSRSLVLGVLLKFSPENTTLKNGVAPKWKEGALFWGYCWSCSNIWLHLLIFLRDPVIDAEAHIHEHTITPMNTHFTPLSTSEELSWTGKSQDWRSYHRRLMVDGYVTYHWKIAPLNTRINFEKYEHPCQVGNLNPGEQVPPQGTQLVELRSDRNYTSQYIWSNTLVHRKQAN
jgi:hypothetical protein